MLYHVPFFVKRVRRRDYHFLICGTEARNCLTGAPTDVRTAASNEHSDEELFLVSYLSIWGGGFILFCNQAMEKLTAGIPSVTRGGMNLFPPSKSCHRPLVLPGVLLVALPRVTPRGGGLDDSAQGRGRLRLCDAAE